VTYPPYPPYPGYPGYPPPPPQRTNGMAVAALICAFVFAPLGIVFGHLSLSQIRRTGEHGRGLAIAGLVLGYLLTVLGVLAVIAMVVLMFMAAQFANYWHTWDPSHPGSSPATDGPLPSATLPPFKPPTTLGSNCQYPATTEPASKPATPPRTGRVPTTPATVPATVMTNDGPIGLTLDNAKAPCTVNNFASLAQQGYFDGTTCHRLATSHTENLLQCGDPTGKGAGGPGYRFPNEYPTNQYRMTDPALQQPITYPRGTLIMANEGPGTNGSQFSLVYQDTALPPMYTAFGTIDAAGLSVLDGIAAAGVADGSDDGAPARSVTIQSVRLN
jgi:peptidyl-prolyl cis-trans isomerase B (cyclophilin B)